MSSKKRKKPAGPRPPRPPKIRYTEPTATIVENSPLAARMTAYMNAEHQHPLVWPTSVEPPVDLDYSKAIYTFNVSTKTQRIPRPNAPAGEWTIHGRGPDEKFGRGPTFPEYFNEISEKHGERIIRRVDGRFIAQDLINPEQPFGSIHSAAVPGYSLFVNRNENTNLYFWGCFWSNYPEPSKEELTIATRLLTAKCLELIREAQIYWMDRAPNRRLEIDNSHKFAAATLAIRFEWL